jgi:hypothetical protein
MTKKEGRNMTPGVWLLAISILYMKLDSIEKVNKKIYSLLERQEIKEKEKEIRKRE